MAVVVLVFLLLPLPETVLSDLNNSTNLLLAELKTS
jgi:hypothetical protein